MLHTRVLCTTRVVARSEDLDLHVYRQPLRRTLFQEGVLFKSPTALILSHHNGPCWVQISDQSGETVTPF